MRKNLYRRKNLHYLNTRSRAPPNGEARFGGFLLIATGCRIAKMQDFPVADMIPAMMLVMPLSALWTNYIAPLLWAHGKKHRCPKRRRCLHFCVM